MKKNPWNMLKMGVVSCAVLVSVSASVLPVASIASADSVVPISATTSAVPVVIKEVVLTSKSTDLTTNIKVPQLSGMLDTKYQDELNNIILSHANKDLASWEKDAAEAAAAAKDKGYTYRPYGLTIVYTLKSDGTGNPSGVVSLTVTTYGETGGTGMPRVDTYNVLNAAAAQRVTLQDLLGADYKATIDAGVIAKMEEEPQYFFKDQFKGISSEQGFYVEKGAAVVVFPKYAIAAGVAGSPEFRFVLPNDLTIKPNPTPLPGTDKVKVDLAPVDVEQNEDGVTLVPFRKVAEGLGYTVKWNQDTYAAELSKGAQWTSVSVGKDSYFFAKMAPVALGAAPVILNDTLYVPTKFVSDILKADVTIDSKGIHIAQ
ncbi:hypothetical protein PAECIP111891_01759 [Paenibacillus allorhizoplanae]|uniref:DUF3298 and DUF4163 domain-containing protein n=1 Tax=Paenibacillus allorhizoplanae TaxID=2905648 RepID=A0ABM9C2I0_9BACL|nr:stalk domain-containing protein [Paenibacillus allorhizoplanae]CAH1200442.1 hypothetical protein PAECIP111891_01759 [Paenibacillus allorhizoplanae]